MDVAIADGFEVWLGRVDDEFGKANETRRHSDFDPLVLFRAYENGTPAATFVADPNAPLVPPNQWLKRLNRPATVARAPYWPIVGIVVALISIILIRGVGLENLVDYIKLDGQRTQIAQVERNSISGSQYRKTLKSRRVVIEDREARSLYDGLMFTYLPAMAMWLTVCLMFTSSMYVYLRLNYWPGRRLRDAGAKIGLKPKVPVFPDN